MEATAKPSRVRPVILSLVGIGIIAAFIYYLYANADKYKELLRISPLLVLALFVLTALFPVINSSINAYLIQSMGADISYRDSFLLTAFSNLANQLPISGGVISKGFYLKRRYGISYTKSFSAAVALFFCFIAVNGLIGIFILLYWALFRANKTPPVLWLGFIAMSSALVVFWLPVNRVKIPEKIQKWISEAAQGWAVISQNPITLSKIIGLQAALLVLAAMRYWLAFYMLSQKITFSQASLFASASVLSQLVSIAPGDLGIREAIVGTLASILGFDVGVSVVAVGLDRLVSTFTIFALGGVSAYALSGQIFDQPENIKETDAA